MYYKIALFFFITTLTFSCRLANKEPETNDCKYGIPTAIFQKNQPNVEMHSFRASETEGTEIVRFSNGVVLTLLQSGCNNIRQEFRFEFPTAPETDQPQYWIAQSINLLRMLGSMGPDYQVFSMWAQAIEARAKEIKLAETLELQQGFYTRIDRIAGANNATLVITLSDMP